MSVFTRATTSIGQMKHLYGDDNNIPQDDVIFHGSNGYVDRGFDFIECGSIKSDVVFSENDIYDAALPVIPLVLNNTYINNNQW